MYKKFINTFISAFTFALFSLTSGTVAFAAEADENTDIPKGIIIFIMIVIFVATAVIAGFASYKIKTRNIDKSDKDNSEETKDQ